MTPRATTPAKAKPDLSRGRLAVSLSCAPSFAD
jgi:hypothetical protein